MTAYVPPRLEDGRTGVLYCCPLCEWHHEMVMPRLSADEFGNIDEAIRDAIYKACSTTEAALTAHLETHTMLEWVAALAKARKEVAEVTEERNSLARVLVEVVRSPDSP